MDVVSFDASTVTTFAATVRPLIERDPVPSSILATVLDQAINGTPAENAVWTLIIDGDVLVSAAMQTPPFNLFLTPVPSDVRGEVLTALVDHLWARRPDLPGVTGLIEDVRRFADAWTQRTGRPQTPGRSERLYELTAVPLRSPAPGSARVVGESDIARAASWVEAFHLEASPDRAGMNGEAAVRYRLTRGWMLFWEVDGEPVSMAGLNRGIAGVSRIGPVYTPPLHRGRGFGSAVTTAASRLAFDQGSTRCMLYTDLANPTSNAIYQAIGYRPVADGAVVSFG